MSVTEKATQAGQTHSMELIFFPLFLLLFVGIIANNYSGSGLQTNPVLPTPCQSLAICYPTNTNGCDNNVQNCNFTSKTSFGFLNANSPFTLLLQGNIVGFFSNVFSNGETQNIVYSGFTTCIPLNGKNFFNATGSAIHNFMCQGISSVNSTNFKPITGVPMNATANGGNNSIFTVTGCLANSNFNYPCTVNAGSDGFASWNGTNSQSSFYAFYVKNGTSISGSASCTIFSTNPACQIIMPWLYTNGVTTFTCPSASHVNGLNINATHYYCLLPVVNPTTATTSLPNVFSFWSFIFGVVLFFLGFGLALTAATIGFSINDQGTKLAQAAGIGITVWSFIYSEFGQTWLPNLPFNLGTIGFIGLTAMFFMGLYWRIFTLD